jgi:hypothetical protein
MTGAPVERDERTTAIEYAGYRWSYLVLSFGLLAVIAYRSFAFRQSSWDLLVLVVLGGAVNAIYRGLNHGLYRRWFVLAVVTFLAAAVLAGFMLRLGQ